MEKVSIKKLPHSKIEFEISIPSKELKTFLKKAAEEYSQENPLPGFRPGKASLEAVERKIGKKALEEKAQELAVKEKYLQILKNQKIEAIEYPKIVPKKNTKGTKIKFKVTVSVFPEIKLCNLRKLTIKKPQLEKIKVNPIEVDLAIDRIRKMRAKLITVNRKVEMGDRVEINFKLSMKGVPLEGGTSLNHPLIIGDNKFIPGFEDKLLGMKKNETKKFKLNFPKDYYDKKLRGKEGEFEVKIKLVQKQELPELNDDFVKSNGNFANVEEFKKNMQESIKNEKRERQLSLALNKLFEAIIKNSTAEIPNVLIDEEKGKMFAELEQNVAKMGLDMKTYLDQIKQTKEKILDGWNEDAKKRIKISLALKKIATEQKLKISKKEITEGAKKIMEDLKKEAPAKAEELDLQDLKRYVKVLIINEKAVEWLKKEILNI
jgi:trigger factor